MVTTFTVGADTPDAMGEKARSYREAKSIKVKLTGELELDLERVRAVRSARPDVWLGVDGNQGFQRDQLESLIATLERAPSHLEPEARVAMFDIILPSG